MCLDSDELLQTRGRRLTALTSSHVFSPYGLRLHSNQPTQLGLVVKLGLGAATLYKAGVNTD